MDGWLVVSGLLEGAISGALIAASGFLKTVSPDGTDDFNTVKFLTTVALGAIAGLLAQVMGTGYDAAITMLVAGGWTILIENWAKAILRTLGLIKAVNAEKKNNSGGQSAPAATPTPAATEYQPLRWNDILLLGGIVLVGLLVIGGVTWLILKIGPYLPF